VRGKGRPEHRDLTKFPVRITRLVTILLLILTRLVAGARVNVVTLPGRDSVQLTIYNSVDLTLVKETRLLTFRKGLNRLEFSWANTLIDSTSVEIRAVNHADEIDVLDVSFPPRAPNTLEWRIKSDFAGEVRIEIRYFTSGIAWSADYLVEATRLENRMDLAGHVRVTNQSGEDYENAQIRLVVGVIRIVEEIAELARRSQGLTTNEKRVMLRSDTKLLREAEVDLSDRFGVMEERLGESKEKGIVKEGLSEYFLYTVEGRDTIPNGWSKRLPSFRTADVPIRSLYKYEREQWGDKVLRFYNFTNSTPNKLGKEPLPDGKVMAFRIMSDDRLYAFSGSTAVKYIPVNENIDLQLGNDAAVSVKPTITDWQKTDLRFDRRGNVTGWTTHESWTLELQNSKEINVFLDVRRNFAGDWSIKTPTAYEKVDAAKIKFLVPLKPRAKQSITYVLTTRHGTNATR